jgi:hypothetical protein
MLFFAPSLSASQINDEPLELHWLDLIPPEERHNFPSMTQVAPHDESTSLAAQQSKIGNVRPELNNHKVKLPGFVIPLEGDNVMITEFLLVPFVGACVHVPPPPPNQIIYVKFPQGAPIYELWDVVYVVGTLKTETINHELAETAYVIEGDALEVYDNR